MEEHTKDTGVYVSDGILCLCLCLQVIEGHRGDTTGRVLRGELLALRLRVTEGTIGGLVQGTVVGRSGMIPLIPTPLNTCDPS